MYERLNLQMTCGHSFVDFVASFAADRTANFDGAAGKSRKNSARRSVATRCAASALARVCAQKVAALMTAAGLSSGSSIIPNDICRSRAFLRAQNISLCIRVVYNKMQSAADKNGKQMGYCETRSFPVEDDKCAIIDSKRRN